MIDEELYKKSEPKFTDKIFNIMAERILTECLNNAKKALFIEEFANKDKEDKKDNEQ